MFIVLLLLLLVLVEVVVVDFVYVPFALINYANSINFNMEWQLCGATGAFKMNCCVMNKELIGAAAADDGGLVAVVVVKRHRRSGWGMAKTSNKLFCLADCCQVIKTWSVFCRVCAYVRVRKTVFVSIQI